jgi:AcrR family transcriptional regulator
VHCKKVRIVDAAKKGRVADNYFFCYRINAVEYGECWIVSCDNIVEEQGVKALTQPRVAKAAGLRQSHLTYYFPRKADLFVALLQASHERASRMGDTAPGKESFEDAMEFLKKLMFDQYRMRFFLGIIVEASEEPELRPVLAAHAQGLTDNVARQFGRDSDDPAVRDFVDLLRGIGLRMLLEPDCYKAEEINLETLAASVGLYRTKAP